MFIIHNVEWIIRNAQIFKAAVHTFGLFVAISVWNLQIVQPMMIKSNDRLAHITPNHANYYYRYTWLSNG